MHTVIMNAKKGTVRTNDVFDTLSR